MGVRHSISKLACGNATEDIFELKDVLERLDDNISRFTKRLFEEIEKEEYSVDLVSFYSRNILEGVCTALLARFDPYRILLVHKIQSQGYELTKRSKVAVQWSEDIYLIDSKKDLWHESYKTEEYSRAILSRHFGELFWIPGFEKAFDFINEQTNPTLWTNDFVSFSEENLFNMIRSNLQKLFSYFSKGVHFEFLIDPKDVMDRETIIVKVIQMYKVLSYLCFTSHFIGICNTNLKKDTAFNFLKQIEEDIEKWSTNILK